MVSTLLIVRLILSTMMTIINYDRKMLSILPWSITDKVNKYNFKEIISKLILGIFIVLKPLTPFKMSSTENISPSNVSLIVLPATTKEIRTAMETSKEKHTTKKKIMLGRRRIGLIETTTTTIEGEERVERIWILYPFFFHISLFLLPLFP